MRSTRSCPSDRILWHFLHFRLDVVTRRLEHELGELKRRIHILDGFATVFDALDQILSIRSDPLALPALSARRGDAPPRTRARRTEATDPHPRRLCDGLRCARPDLVHQIGSSGTSCTFGSTW